MLLMGDDGAPEDENASAQAQFERALELCESGDEECVCFANGAALIDSLIDRH